AAQTERREIRVAADCAEIGRRSRGKRRVIIGNVRQPAPIETGHYRVGPALALNDRSASAERVLANRLWYQESGARGAHRITKQRARRIGRLAHENSTCPAGDQFGSNHTESGNACGVTRESAG